MKITVITKVAMLGSQPGDPVELDELEAKRLLKMGFVVPEPATKETAEAVSLDVTAQEVHDEQVSRPPTKAEQEGPLAVTGGEVEAKAPAKRTRKKAAEANTEDKA